jgi:hypothetical protein
MGKMDRLFVGYVLNPDWAKNLAEMRKQIQMDEQVVREYREKNYTKKFKKEVN